jgi:hypothetical protein
VGAWRAREEEGEERGREGERELETSKRERERRREKEREGERGGEGEREKGGGERDTAREGAEEPEDRRPLLPDDECREASMLEFVERPKAFDDKLDGCRSTAFSVSDEKGFSAVDAALRFCAGTFFISRYCP